MEGRKQPYLIAMSRKFPRADFRTEPGELDRVFTFNGSDEQLAELIGVSTRKIGRWHTGTDPVPKAVFELLRFKYLYERSTTLGKHFGPWSGWKLSKRGDGLENPFRRSFLYLEDAARIEECRHAHELTGKQAELIERLMIERDFYRQQCHREAKYGLMLNRLFLGG